MSENPTARRGAEQLAAMSQGAVPAREGAGAVGIAAAIEAILADIAKPAAASAETATPARG